MGTLAALDWSSLLLGAGFGALIFFVVAARRRG